MIAVICSSNKPQYWQYLYYTLSQNKTPFNLTIVGPYSPSYSLPPNFKFIKSNVKPAQCAFIALHNTEGKYVIHVVDDIELPNGLLDGMVDILSKCSEYDVVTGGLVYEDAYICQGDIVIKLVDPDNKDINRGIVSFPVPVPYHPMMYRDSMVEIGVDQKFKGSYWDMDISLELVSRGGNVIHCGEVVYETTCESELRLHNSLDYDLTILLSMWVEDIMIASAPIIERGARYRHFVMQNHRREKIEPLEYIPDVHIRSQGYNDPERWD